MALIYGRPGDEPGDRQVYKALENLPSEWLVYAQPKIVLGSEEGNPDYVLVHRQYGYIVIEVKDWVSIENPDAKGVFVKRNNRPEAEWEKSPVEQGRMHAQLISSKLSENPLLRNYQGKLDFPYRFAGVLPNLRSSTISWLESFWGSHQVLGQVDLAAERITDRISQIPAKFTVTMTEPQFNAVRVVLDKSNAAIDMRSGEIKGVYSQKQEEIAKAPFHPPSEAVPESAIEKQVDFWGNVGLDQSGRMGSLESDLPAEVIDLRKARNVKLVRGFSGTGKTDVLVMRARYLYENNPEIHILVTTYNNPLVEERLKPEFQGYEDRINVQTFDSLCAAVYRKRTSTWNSPISSEGLIKNIELREGLAADIIQKFGCSFIEQEIGWMKDTGLTERDKYLGTHREGRAKSSGKTLQANQKAEIFQVYEVYQNKLEKELRNFDWQDMRKTVLGFIEAGEQPETLYDAIFIDEAQHFAPLWMKIVLAHLKPNGSIFICDDPSQSVYRMFSWEQRGIDVRGKTRWLRIPYRTTMEIFETAYLLIQGNPLSKKLLDESGDPTIPDLSSVLLRRGDAPAAIQFNSFEKEKEFVQNLVKEKMAVVLPSEIAVLHSEKSVLSTYRGLLPAAVKVDDLKRQTGMEYKVVIIPQVHKLFTGVISFDYEQTKAENQLALYMAMTRARDQVYLLYGQKWPKDFEALRGRLNWMEG